MAEHRGTDLREPCRLWHSDRKHQAVVDQHGVVDAVALLDQEPATRALEHVVLLAELLDAGGGSRPIALIGT